MLRALLFLAAGETLLFYGLWSAWAPLAFICVGAQAVYVGLNRETGERK